VIPGKTRLQPRSTGPRLDQRDPGANLLAIDLLLERAVADPNPGDIGNRIQFAGCAQPQRNAQL